MSQDIAKKYDLDIPEYPGVDQVVELPDPTTQKLGEESSGISHGVYSLVRSDY